MIRILLSSTALMACLILVGCSQHAANPAEGNGGFISASDWKAWINMQPPGPHTLHVSGKVKVAAAGDTPSLVFDSLDKSNPPVLHLKVVIERGGGGQVITEKPVSYSSRDQLSLSKIVIHYPNGQMETITDIGMVH